MLVNTPVESILALAASVFDAYSVVLFEAPAPGHRSQIIAAYSMGDCIDQDAALTPGRGLVGWILRNASPIVVSSVDENQTHLGYYKEDRVPAIRSFLGCPLSDGGVLCVDSLKQHAFSAEKQELIAVFADMLVQVQAMEMKEGSDEAADYLQTLDRLADLRQNYPGWKGYLTRFLPLLLEASGFDYVTFASRMDGSPTYVVEGEYPARILTEGKPVEISVHNGIIGWVFRNEEPVFNDGFSGSMPVFGKREGMPDLRSTVCLPVMVSKSTCGVLCLAAEAPGTIPDRLRTFLRLAADDLARLLETLSLRYRVRMAEKNAARKEA